METIVKLNGTVQKENSLNEELKIKSGSLDIFDQTSNYIFSMKLFYAYFGDIPNLLVIRNIDAGKLKNWIENKFTDRKSVV